MARKHATDEDDTEINITPMLDIVFIMLIFFIVTTSFIKETGIEVKRPEAASGEAKSGDLILVGISTAGTIHMNGKRVDLSAVRPSVSQMRLKTPKAPVIVLADEAARASIIVRVLDECKLAGVEDISLSTRSPGSGS